jgi:hypothetical protein
MFIEIPGAEAIVSWFGKWPSFHDAEILELHLERVGQSWIKIHHVAYKPAVVTFKLDGVTDLELADFSQQNAIASLNLEQTETGLRLTLWPCYGLAGYLEAERMSVELSPDKLL